MEEIVAVIDIGHSKIACIIVKKYQLIGLGYHATQGMENGMVTNMQDLAESIAKAVSSAESMCHEIVRKVYIGLNTSEAISEVSSLRVDLSPKPLSSQDMEDMANKITHSYGKEYLVIHKIPIYYNLDSTHWITNPVGMVGKSLEIFVHHLILPNSLVKNILLCLENCHLNVLGVSFSPLMLNKVLLSKEEQDLDTAVIDMGADHTCINISYKGSIVNTLVLPIGGSAISKDLSIAFSTTIGNAEKIKVLHGNAYKIEESKENIEIPQLGGEKSPLMCSKKNLTHVIEHRLEYILSNLYHNLSDSNLLGLIGPYMVVSGGGSQLNGIETVIAKVFKKNARTAKSLFINNQELSGNFKPYDVPFIAGAVAVYNYVYHNGNNLMPLKKGFLKKNLDKLKKLFKRN